MAEAVNDGEGRIETPRAPRGSPALAGYRSTPQPEDKAARTKEDSPEDVRWWKNIGTVL